MKVVAVICEYNPFHNGHLRQIEMIREKWGDCVILALMSGSFVQRGEPAVFPKYDRAELAVRCGVDLVLELPYPWSGASAPFFAGGAVSVLRALGCVDVLCFGSECGVLEELWRTAENLDSAVFRQALEEARSAGGKEKAQSGIRIAEKTYREVFGDGFPILPNDILAVSYLRAAAEIGFTPEFYTYVRKPGFSATRARDALMRDDTGACTELLPREHFALPKAEPARITYAERILLWKLRTEPSVKLFAAAETEPGMDRLFRRVAERVATFAEFESMVGLKKYTRARVRRAVRNIVLGTTDDMLREKPQYTMLLAASGAGCALLKRMKKTARICVLTKPADYTGHPEIRAQFEHSLLAEELYGMMLPVPRQGGAALRMTPFILG